MLLLPLEVARSIVTNVLLEPQAAPLRFHSSIRFGTLAAERAVA
jgi:hypothetical protein